MVAKLDSSLRPHLWRDGPWWCCAIREDGVTFQQVSSVTPEAAYAYWLSQRPAWVQRFVLGRFPSMTRKVQVAVFNQGGFLS